jgi:formate hydrogenlyase subunit 3/multisubunit Na+/H+ antiporter MnhD subunit
VGEFLVLLGAFRANPWWAAFAAVGVILSAVYMLWMFQRVMFGPVTHAENEKLSDLTFRERLVFAPILVLIFVLGFFPQPFIERMQPALDRTLALAADRYEGVTGQVASWATGLEPRVSRPASPLKIQIIRPGEAAGGAGRKPPESHDPGSHP